MSKDMSKDMSKGGVRLAIPKSMMTTYAQIEPLISSFCFEHLDEDYRQLCLKMLEKLCRKRPSPLLCGKPNSWAAGIVYFLCAENNYFRGNDPGCLRAAQLAACFGLSASAAYNRAAKIRSLCRLKSFSQAHWFDWIADDNNDWRLPS